MRLSKSLTLAVTVLGMLANVAPLSAQDNFGANERFDSDFYGDLATRNDERLYSASATAATADGGPRAASTSSGSSTAAKAAKADGAVPASYTPWSGMWFPRGRCDLAFGDYGGGLSPFEKYDSIVASLYGQLAGAAAWEADPIHRHNTAPFAQQVDWAGHCNGLAAACILTPEPKKAFTVDLGSRPVKVKLNIASAARAKEYLYSDGQSDYRTLQNPGKSLPVSVADMKGLLAESYMTCNTQQFYNRTLTGTRYTNENVNVNDESFKDIYPHYFHWLLQEFVKKNGMAIVAEIDPHFTVNNHPLYKYETSYVFNKAKRKYSVTTKAYFTNYAPSAQYVGTNTMTRTYTYDLFQDASGRVNRGDWTGTSVTNHPDFCWIPTSDAKPSGTYENACLNGDFVRWIYSKYGM